MLDMSRLPILVALVIVSGLAPLAAQEEKPTAPTSGPVKIVPSVGALYEPIWRHPDLGFRNPDGSVATVQTLLDAESADFASADWQRSQIEWMMEAGLDFFAPSWRYLADRPDEEASLRSNQALEAILKAMVQIAADGGRPPRMALHIDGEILRRSRRDPALEGSLDLREPEALRALEESIFHFFRRVPKSLRWELDGYPLIIMGPALGAAHDRDLFERIADDFVAEFRTRPFIVADPSWKSRSGARWQPGAALHGPQGTSEVQVVGPGYDDTRIPGRGTPVRKREDGRFYEWSWRKILLANPTIVLVETWNRFDEGSGIAPCKEYGEFYVELTRRYVARLKGGILPDLEKPVRIAFPDPVPRPDEGWFKMQDGLDRVFWVAASHETAFGFGLRLIEIEDGPTSRVTSAGKAAVRLPASTLGTYLYIGIADEFAHRVGGSFEIEVVCRGATGSELALQYDSWDRSAPHGGAYRSAPKTTFEDAEIRRLVWQLPDARFGNRQNAGSDFRLFSKGESLAILGIQVRRLPERLRSTTPVLIER